MSADIFFPLHGKLLCSPEMRDCDKPPRQEPAAMGFDVDKECGH